jgi:hypothetical protein
VDAKVSRYRDLAGELDVPLVVAVGAHKFLGLELDDLDDLLAGTAAFAFQFGGR